MSFASNVDHIVAGNRTHAADFAGGDLAVRPSRQLAVVTCMDARLDLYRILGIENGQAHLIRNAGGVVTDDVIRSLCLSQRALGTREILVIHHTKCGLHGLDEPALRAELEAETGVKPAFAFEGFADPHDDVRQSIERIRRSPFIQHTDQVHGFVYDVEDGLLYAVD